jgi:hypothetical protein
VLLEIMLRVKAFKQKDKMKKVKERKAMEEAGEVCAETEDDDSVGNALKLAYMSAVKDEEMGVDVEGSTEFLENRLRLRKYFREFKLYSTKHWRDI